MRYSFSPPPHPPAPFPVLFPPNVSPSLPSKPPFSHYSPSLLLSLLPVLPLTLSLPPSLSSSLLPLPLYPLSLSPLLFLSPSSASPLPSSEYLFVSFDLILLLNLLLVKKSAAVLSLHQIIELLIILDCIYAFLFLFS